MANNEHLQILKKGVIAWNQWRKWNPGLKPDLSQADFHGADLERANFYWANLSGANFSGGNLVLAKLGRADLLGASLCGADLNVAELGVADLRGAQLLHADLSETHLDGADFTDAEMGYTVLGNVDLSEVTGLETIDHEGPSTIGIDTIYLSKGKIPDVFLRGAGVPDEFITYMRSLVANPIEYYSCFISYSSKDEEFAQRLHADLQAKGVRCWFAPHDIQGGRKLHEQIDQAIRVHERVLLILSADSMNSEWVKTEIAKARKREVEQKKQVLFPLPLVSFEAIRDWECFDADAGKDSAGEIREYFIPDFSNWKNHDEYQKAFGRLMGDLKAGEKGEGKMATSRSPLRGRVDFSRSSW